MKTEEIIKQLTTINAGLMTVLEYSLINKENEQSELLALLTVKLEAIIATINKKEA